MSEYERHAAIREAGRNAAELAYFKARHIDMGGHSSRVFGAGFDRGFDAATERFRARIAGLDAQHHRDSAELRRLCAARDEQRDGRLANAERAAAAESRFSVLNERISELEAQLGRESERLVLTSGNLDACLHNFRELKAQQRAGVPDEWRTAVQEFVDRVERGEVRSKRTYAKFKELLAAAPAPEAQEKCVCGEPDAIGVTHRTDGPCYQQGPAPQPAEVGADERAKFEAQFVNRMNLGKWEDGNQEYTNHTTQLCWESWQARAQLTEGADAQAWLIVATKEGIPSHRIVVLNRDDAEGAVRHWRERGCHVEFTPLAALTAAGGRDAPNGGFNYIQGPGWVVEPGLSVQQASELSACMNKLHDAAGGRDELPTRSTPLCA